MGTATINYKVAGGAAIDRGIVSYVWAGASSTNAPATATEGAIGLNQNGIAGSDVFHFVNGGWLDTTAAASNLYGV